MRASPLAKAAKYAKRFLLNQKRSSEIGLLSDQRYWHQGLEQQIASNEIQWHDCFCSLLGSKNNSDPYSRHFSIIHKLACGELQQRTNRPLIRIAEKVCVKLRPEPPYE